MAGKVYSGTPSNTEAWQSSARNASNVTFVAPLYSAANGSNAGNNRHSHLTTPARVTLIGRDTSTSALVIKPKTTPLVLWTHQRGCLQLDF